MGNSLPANSCLTPVTASPTKANELPPQVVKLRTNNSTQTQGYLFYEKFSELKLPGGTDIGDHTHKNPHSKRHPWTSAVPRGPPTEGSSSKTICHEFIHRHREKPQVNQNDFTKVTWKIALRKRQTHKSSHSLQDAKHFEK